jgi:hypothetical protein
MTTDVNFSFVVLFYAQSLSPFVSPTRAPFAIPSNFFYPSLEHRPDLLWQFKALGCRTQLDCETDTATGTGTGTVTGMGACLSVLVVIDDAGTALKSVSSSAANDDDGGEGNGGVGSVAGMRVAELLRRLCAFASALARRPHSPIRVAVLCAGRALSAADIDATLARPPGFDYIVGLPRPTEHERAVLLASLAQRSGLGAISLPYPHSPDVCDPAYDTATFAWSAAVAALTPGRSPGDLAGAIAHLNDLNIHRYCPLPLSNILHHSPHYNHGRHHQTTDR